MVSTIAGVAIMWALVSYLHSGEIHNHGADSTVHEESIHSDEHSDEHDDEHADEHDHE